MSVCPHAFAQTWNGGGTNNNWSTAANWTTVAPLNNGTASLTFAGTTRLNPDANGGGWNVNSLTFASGAGAFTLSGGGLTLGAGGITNNSTNGQTIQNQLALGANQTWNAASGAITTTAYFDANSKNLTLSGSSAITVSGQLNNAATLTLSGSGNRTFGNSVSATTVNAGASGTTAFNSQINVGTLNVTAGTNTFANVQAGTGINLGGTANASFTGPVSGGSNGIHITSSGAIDFSGTINSGSITLDGTGTTTLSGSGGKSTGAVVVNSGTLVLAQTGGGDAINNTLTVNDGGTVVFAGNNQIPEWQTVTLTDGATMNVGNTTQSFAHLVISGDTIIDFGGGGSSLNITYGGITFENDATLTILNWNSAVDHFSASVNPGSNLPRVIFDGYGDAVWNPSGGSITPGAPVPEPGTYGLLAVGSLVAVAALRRRTRCPGAAQASSPE